MKILIVIIFTIIQIRASKQDCNIVVINSKNYEKQVLKDNVHQPYQLSLDPQTNTLFFSYTTEARPRDIQKIGSLNLATKEFEEITSVTGGFATAVDTAKHIVYFGGRDGIYTYDYTTKTVKNLGITNYSIWQMFYSPIHGLLFTNTDHEKLFSYKDGLVNPFYDLSSTKTRFIAVGEHHEIFFANTSGIYVFNQQKRLAVDIGHYNVNGFTKDSSGKIYFITPVGFYSINEKDRKINKLVSEDGDDTVIWGGAFDKDDNIVYSIDNSILKLVETDKTC